MQLSHKFKIGHLWKEQDKKNQYVREITRTAGKVNKNNWE